MAADAINKVKQDLATKEIEQRLKQEKKQQRNKIVSAARAELEISDNLKIKGNCNTLKSIITVGGHEVVRNVSEPSDQTLMQIDVYAEYLRNIIPQTLSRAIRSLMMRGGGKSIRIDSRYTEAYGPQEVMLNIDGINNYTKTMITRN